MMIKMNFMRLTRHWMKSPNRIKTTTKTDQKKLKVHVLEGVSRPSYNSPLGKVRGSVESQHPKMCPLFVML